MIEKDDAYYFQSIEEMQAYIQIYGPLKDGKSIYVGEAKIR